MTKEQIQEYALKRRQGLGALCDNFARELPQAAPGPSCEYGVRNSLARLAEAMFWANSAIDVWAQVEIEAAEMKSPIIQPDGGLTDAPAE